MDKFNNDNMNQELVINAENTKFKTFKAKVNKILNGSTPENKTNTYYEVEKQNHCEKYLCRNELKINESHIYENNIVDIQAEIRNICAENSSKPCENTGGTYLDSVKQTNKHIVKKKDYFNEFKIKEERSVESKSTGNIQNEVTFLCKNKKEKCKFEDESKAITDMIEINRKNDKKKSLKCDADITATPKVNPVKSRKRIKKFKKFKSKIKSKEFCIEDSDNEEFKNCEAQEQANKVSVKGKYYGTEIPYSNRPKRWKSDNNMPNYGNIVEKGKDQLELVDCHSQDINENLKNIEYSKNRNLSIYNGANKSSIIAMECSKPENINLTLSQQEIRDNPGISNSPHSNSFQNCKFFDSIEVKPLNPEVSNDIKLNFNNVKLNTDVATNENDQDLFLKSSSILMEDIQPIQMEMIVSPDSKIEIEKENVNVKNDIDKYLKSFVKCSSGSVVEYPLSNYDPPNGKGDLITWQLNKIFLPQFKPFIEPPPWLRLTIPSEGYSCSICGDIFFMESSLVQHKERRSVWISLDCGPCDAKLKFYNRCAFKDHIREHSLIGESVDVESVIVESLPLQLSKLLQPIMVPVPEALRQTKERPFLNHASKLEENIVKDNSSVGIISTKSYNSYNCKEPSSNITDTSQNKRHVLCYLCERLFSNVRELMSHMRTNQTYSDQRVKCRKCLLVLPSVCAAKAHILTHPPANASNISVCPECGSKCEGPRDFVHHLNTCGHQFRRSGILCTLCQVCFFKLPEDFINHWIKEHCLKFFECVVCSKTFPTVVFHKCCSPGENNLATFKRLLRCPLCSFSFQHHAQDERELQEKIKSHLSDFHKQLINRVYYVYKSKFCTNAFKSKDELRAHHDREHKKDNQYRTKTCILYHEVLRYQSQYFNGQEPRSAFITLPVALSAEELLDAKTRDVPTVSSVVEKSFSSSSPISFEDDNKLSNLSFHDSEEALERLSPCICYMCGYNYTWEKQFQKHKQQCGGELTERLCQDCGVTAYGKEFSTHCMNHIIDGHIICIYCNGAPFSSQKNLQRHFELHVYQQFTYPLKCVFCSFVMIDAQIALSHILDKHDPLQLQKINLVEPANVHNVKSALTSTQLSSDLASSITLNAAGQQCQVCKKALNSVIFSKHMICHLEEGLFLCCLCDGLVLPSSMALLKHLELHVKSLSFPYHCLMCSTEINDPTDAMLHMKEDHGFGDLTCDNCEMNYKFRYQLQRHIDIVHRICLFSKRRYICWICRAYDNVKKEMLMSHFQSAHLLSKDEVDETVMIRTRGQGTMPSSHFVPIKPIGCKENKENSFVLSPNKSNLVDSKHSAKSNSISLSKSDDIQVSGFNSSSLNTNIKSVIKPENNMNIDVRAEPYLVDCSSTISLALNADTWDGLYAVPKSESISLDDILERKLLHKISKKNRDRKLINNTKVLIKRLPESLESDNGTVILQKDQNISLVKDKKCFKAKTFQCNRCSFGTNSTDKYEHHLNKHTADTENFKCEACGESFVVEISLRRHMFFAHKVKKSVPVIAGKLLQTNLISVPPIDNEKVVKPRVSRVLKANQKRSSACLKRKRKQKSGVRKLKLSRSNSKSSWHHKISNRRFFLKKVKRKQPVPSLEINLEEQTKLSDFQCSVCYQDFSTDAQLFSHLRTHGMAFLKVGLKKRTKSSEATDTGTSLLVT